MHVPGLSILHRHAVDQADSCVLFASIFKSPGPEVDSGAEQIPFLKLQSSRMRCPLGLTDVPYIIILELTSTSLVSVVPLTALASPRLCANI